MFMFFFLVLYFIIFLDTAYILACCVYFLQRWLAQRQMRFEGGFQGRTNKLVDGCYSFWQAGAFPVVHSVLSKQDTSLDCTSWMFNEGVCLLQIKTSDFTEL